jgi:hypothetical protein
MFDGKAFGAELVTVVKDYVERQMVPVIVRFDEIERRVSEIKMPDPYDDAEIRSDISALRDAIDALPFPLDGKDGRDGIDGKDGAPGERGEPGEKGECGTPGEPGLHGKDGASGKDGRDGLDAVEFLRGVDGHLVVTLSNGTTRDLGTINGRDGEPGRDGLDANSEAILEKVTASLPVVEKAIDFAPDDVAESVSRAIKTMAGYVPKVAEPERKDTPQSAPVTVHMPPVNIAFPEQPAPIVNMAAPVVNVAPAEVRFEAPKRGKEVTRVTEWDKSGRIKTFEKREEDD